MVTMQHGHEGAGQTIITSVGYAGTGGGHDYKRVGNGEAGYTIMITIVVLFMGEQVWTWSVRFETQA